MKKLTLIILITFHTSLFTVHLSAQLPNFTLVDTGAIYEINAHRLHISGIVIDVDNDGDLDPVIGKSSWDPYVLLLFKNERKCLYKQSIFLPEVTNAFPIRDPSPAGDIDNDGDLDMIGQKIWAEDLGVFINDGYGNFLSDTTYVVPNILGSFYPVLLDFNEDGYLDLIRFDTAIVVLYNNGEGVFENQTKIGYYDITGHSLQHSMSWADVDNDGDMDVYLGMSWGKNLFFINTGTWLEPVDEDNITLSENEATHSVNWIDYDNDGDMDLYTVDALFENLGSMEFEKHIIREEQYDSDSVWSSSRTWGDLDNDGDLDLLVSVEHNHLLGDSSAPLSAHPYNLLYLNDGNGQFTNVLNHTLTLNDSHTAEIFDHDNDGDLDVLTIGNGWAYNGHNQLFINEGNDNSSILINCIDKYNCASPYGTRIYAKAMINGELVSQIREITPVDGNLSFGNIRMHFGLGDAEVVDSLIIRWPSGHVDTYLDVEANQIYKVFEDSELVIDFAATNYIQYSPTMADININEIGGTTTIDLDEHYQFIKGDTVPPINGDTLTYSVYDIENPGVVQAEVNGSTLSLEADALGETIIRVKASVGFTERVDQFKIKVGVGLAEYKLFNPVLVHISPSPFIDEVTITYEIPAKSNVRLDIYNYSGQHISTLVDEVTQQGKYEIKYDGKELRAGIYFCILKTNQGIQTKKMIKL